MNEQQSFLKDFGWFNDIFYLTLVKSMTQEKEQKGLLKRFGKWAPIIGGAWVILNIVLPLLLLRIPVVHNFLVSAGDKLPFDIPGIG